MNAEDFERLGIYDPGSPDADDELRLLEYIAGLGASEDELVDAFKNVSLGDLALSLILRPAGRMVPFEEAVKRSGLEVDDAARFVRALGFPDPRFADNQIPEKYVEHLSIVVGGGKEFLGEDTTLAIARVMGAACARLAQAVLDGFRAKFEVPQRQSGVTYTDVVIQYGEIISSLLPVFMDAVDSTFRDHLVQQAYGAWSFDEEEGVARRELLIGFVDMVGYSSLSRGISSGRLAQLVVRFEDLVTEIVSRHEGRVIKLIGDGAMFVCPDSAGGCRLALDLVDHFDRDANLPAVHIGLAFGPLVALNGDYFGNSVNVAARLLGLASASTILIDGAVAGAVAKQFEVSELEPARLEGTDLEGPVYSLLS